MKKNLKRAGAALVTLALCAGMMPAAFAATVSVVSWDFANTANSWNPVTGWSGEVTVNTSIDNDMLKINAGYSTAKDPEWRPASVGYTFEEPQNFTGVTEISYDLYVPTEKKDVITQSYAIVQEPWDAETESAPYTSNSVRLSEIPETSEENIGGTVYTKYRIAMKLTPYTNGVSLEDITSNVNNIIIQVIGTSNETITTYIDNVSLNKEAAEEEPVGDYLYTHPGSVEMTLPSSSSQWPYKTLNIDPAVTVYPGAVVEYDVTLANNNFTKFYTEPKFNWTGIANKTVTPSDLINNGDGTYSFHFEGKYDVYNDKKAETIDELGILRIQFQNKFNDNGTDKGTEYDYRGKVIVTNIKVTNGEAPAAETKATATSIGETTDRSLGYYVDVTPDTTTNFANAKWKVTNDEGKTAEKTAVVGDTTIETTVTTEGGVRFGLVITGDAIGENTIEKVEFIY